MAREPEGALNGVTWRNKDLCCIPISALTPVKGKWMSAYNFSLQYHCIINQTGNENSEDNQLGDVIVI